MKLIIITAVKEYEDSVFKLLKTAGIEHFSGSAIDGYKTVPTVLMESSWFPSDKAGAASSLFFSFTEEEKVDALFNAIERFNSELQSTNPVRAVELPISRYI